VEAIHETSCSHCRCAGVGVRDEPGPGAGPSGIDS
jgi:hypothetical protein